MMKVFLLYPDRDFDSRQPPPPFWETLVQDLGLETLFSAMAGGNKFIHEVVERVILASLKDPAEILYRQEILQDCLNHPELIQELYRIPLEFLDRKRKQWLWFSPRHSSPGLILSGARQLLEASLDLLRNLKKFAETNAEAFRSRGFRRFFTMLRQELDDSYLATVETHVKALRFPGGVLLSARLGKGNEGTQYLLCKPNNPAGNWISRIFAAKSPVYSFSLHPRDESGARILQELRDRGLAKVADSVAQAAEHIESFFQVLRWELAFYIGCTTLRDRLVQLKAPFALPQPMEGHGPLGDYKSMEGHGPLKDCGPAEDQKLKGGRKLKEGFVLTARGLYDLSLALSLGEKIVGNDLDADNKNLLVITGPNKGGKTTFLRSLGQAQLLMQAGMFVPAESFKADLVTGLFTHFRREEDRTMERGKFEEELQRMSQMLEAIEAHSFVLMNESFSATNEREGSEVAHQVVTALLESQVKVAFVTHFYEFARRLMEGRVMEEGRNLSQGQPPFEGTRLPTPQKPFHPLFLVAERLPDGRRTYRIKEGIPQRRSYGEDLYDNIFTQPHGGSHLYTPGLHNP